MSEDPSELDRLLALLEQRRSVRAFRAEAPPRALLERVLEAAVLAPSASNKQPWRFFVVKERARIERMAEVVRAATEEVGAHVPEESREAFTAYGDYFVRFERAPVVVVPAHRGHSVLSHLLASGPAGELQGPALSAPRRAAIEAMERESGLIGVSLALMNLLLAAHAAGLGASAMTGPKIAEAELKEILGVPESWGIVALVPMGYPDEAPGSPGRKALRKVVRWIE